MEDRSVRDFLTMIEAGIESEMTFTRAYLRASKVLWIDIFLTIVILIGVASRL